MTPLDGEKALRVEQAGGGDNVQYVEDGCAAKRKNSGAKWTMDLFKHTSKWSAYCCVYTVTDRWLSNADFPQRALK